MVSPTPFAARTVIFLLIVLMVWAFIYNSVGIPVAALGFMLPILAAAAMALSSLSVIGNSALLKRARVGP
ncbi:hypothetical protein [Pseudogulbenkiania sp. MAI-1]|uniref:hypothetical protein n=1 Tax=Pseudogulbenkiania sp. MAI-1 TaxID=990370 RepID=UPI00045E8857|nr:hypothetical protein [Pseudogulbenkiania sp. MAI-1]